MAKQSGLGDHLYVDGFDISGDVGSVGRIAAPSQLLDVTAIDKSGMERIYGLFDGAIEFTAWFNPATDQAHAVVGSKPDTDRVLCYFHGGAVGNMAAGLVAKQATFDGNRAQDGSLTEQAQANGNGFGLDYCEQLTAGKVTHASADEESSFDGGAASALGLAAYLQVFSLGSGSPTVKIQESDDDGSEDTYADVTGGSFGVVAAETAERIVTALDQTIEQYLKVVTTGTFTDLVFAVCATRYPVQ